MSFSRTDKSLDEMWLELKVGIEKIYACDVSRPVSKADYFRLYTLVYNFCTSSRQGTTPPSNNNHLHGKLGLFFKEHLRIMCEKCEDLRDEPLLTHYMQLWSDYRFSSKVVSGVCAYLNRHWVRQEREKNRVDVLEVYHLALVSWKDYLLEPLKKKMAAAVLKLINRERNRETVNSRLISVALNSYIEMGINCADPHAEHPSLYLYKDAFETEFLSETELFYTTECSSIIRKNPVSEFMKKVEGWLQEETRRARLFLHASTLGALVRILEAVAISRHLEMFHSEFQTLLSQGKTADLRRMFQLLSRVPFGLDQLKLQFEQYVTKQGLQAIEQYNESNSSDPRAYISVILDIHQRYNAMSVEAFEGEAGFSAALDKACGSFLNRNTVTGQSGGRSAELLAKHCDRLLRKPSSDSEEVGEALTQAMLIFKYLEEKDVFQGFYSKTLAMRLVRSTSVNDDAETLMIAKLREACGFEYTAKLQRMFQDVCVSRDLSEAFRREQRDAEDVPAVDFSVVVVSSSSWPYSHAHAFSLPQELEQSVQDFTKFYCTKYSGRKLTWLPNISKGELATNYLDKPYTFQTSTFQMAVLLQFNSVDTLSVSQLEESTGIRSDTLVQVLQTLVKTRVLQSSDENAVDVSSSISLIMGYKNKKLKVNINVPLKTEARCETEAVHRHVEEDRNWLIQIHIVRIAKMRKVVKHQVLISEVLKQLSPRFKPKIPMIKKNIDILIEKEYLERVDKDSYCYLA